MIYFAKWKIATILGICLLGLAFLAPNFLSKEDAEGLPSFLPNKQISLGLDLQGGVHLLIEVGVDTVIRERAESVRDDIRVTLRKAKIRYANLGIRGTNVRVTIKDPAKVDQAVSLLQADQAGMEIESNGSAITMSFSEVALNEQKVGAVEQSVEVLVKSGLLDVSRLSVHPYCYESAPKLIEAATIESKQLDDYPELKPYPLKKFPWVELTDDQILEKYENSDAEEFGEAVGKCFNCLGIKWELGRSGDVTDRIDGKGLFANGYMIPVELKSPTEVRQVNLKSVRQAADNAMQAPQIAKDSGKGWKYSLGTASLTIGWEFHPKRSDLENLIQRIQDYWGIRVRALRFSDLIKMARAVSEGEQVDFSAFLSGSGIYRWDKY